MTGRRRGLPTRCDRVVQTHLRSFDFIADAQVDVSFAGISFFQVTFDERLAVGRRAALRVHDFLAGFSCVWSASYRQSDKRCKSGWKSGVDLEALAYQPQQQGPEAADHRSARLPRRPSTHLEMNCDSYSCRAEPSQTGRIIRTPNCIPPNAPRGRSTSSVAL